MRRSSIRLVVVATAAAASVVASGCGGGKAGNSKSASGTVKIRLFADANSLDPATSNSGPAYQLDAFLYDRLVVFKDGKITPSLAKSWDVKPGSITFTLRDDATCSDGTKVTPTVVKDSFTRLLDPATKSEVAQGYVGKGASFSADDAAGTFTVKVTKPNSDLLSHFTEVIFSVVCPGGLASPKQLQTKSFGSGPYTLAKAVRGSSYTLERRREYKWGPQGFAAGDMPDKVILKVVANETTAANLFLSGDLDVMLSQEESSAKRLLGKGYVERKFPLAINFVTFNHASGRVTADKAVRTAIAQALEPKTYAAAAHGQLGTPSGGDIFPTATQCAATDGATLRPAFDAAAARKTLEDAGWRRDGDGPYRKDGKALSLQLVGNDSVGRSPDYAAQSLEDLGAEVRVKVVALDEYVDFMGKGDWDVVAGSLLASPTPSVLGLVFGDPGGLDWGKIRNPAYSAAVKAATLAGSPDEVCAKWKDAQDALLSDVDVVPQVFANYVDFGNKVDFAISSSGLIEPTSIHPQS